jgi:hypothetical protein
MNVANFGKMKLSKKQQKISCLISIPISCKLPRTNKGLKSVKNVGICPTITLNKLNSMPYFTRLIKMDRVGFEPTTSAMPVLFYLRIGMKKRNP